jgi:peptide/nickel transport system substrate-binding protein
MPWAGVGARPQPQLAYELHEALVGDIRKLNPLFADTNPVDRDISALIYEGLTTLNPYGEVMPLLASRWQVSPDGLEYVFILRQDVLWQDGLPFTSADVAYTFRTIRAADFPGDPALRDFWRTVEINVIDAHTVRFRLVQPLASFPERLRQGIVPLHALEGAPIASLDRHPFNLSPIGTGPYQIESLFASNGAISGISLRVAPNYRLRPEGQQAYLLDRVVFRTYPSFEASLEAYRRGEVNSLGVIPPQRLEEVRTLPELTLHTGVAPSLGVIIYNWRRDDLAYLRDPRMHLALARASNRQSAVLEAMAGRAIPTDSPILPSSWAYNPSARYPETDLAEAQRLLSTVSFEPYQPPAPLADENTGETTPEPPPLVEQRRAFRLLVVEDPAIAGVAFEIANQWGALGLTVELELVDQATLLSRLEAGDFDTALVELNFSPKADPDPFVFWHRGQAEKGQNYGAMDDAYISNLLLSARTDHNGLHRKQHYDKFQLAFTSRAPALVLYYPVFVYATTTRLHGVQLDFISTPSDRFRSISAWSLSLDS